MASKLHKDWLKIKQDLDAHLKKFPGLQKPQKFDQDFGPTLDSLGTAYSAKKDAEIKALAKKASGIATAYETKLMTMINANHWTADGNPSVVGLKKIHASLLDLEKHGQAAKNCFS